jgi:hypothetical protein
MNATKMAGTRLRRKRLSSRSAAVDEPTPTQKKKIRLGCEYAQAAHFVKISPPKQAIAVNTQ